MLRRLATCLFFACTTLLFVPASFAACTGPTGPAGGVFFNTNNKVLEYCNGTNWINTGPSFPSAPQTGCTSPASPPGGTIFNKNTAVVQFCNGSSWIDTACANDRTPSGNGCVSPTSPAGKIAFNSNTNQLQYCDSTDWVAMGYDCPIINPPLPSEVYNYTAYTGNGTSTTITNGINFAAKGGMLWVKARNTTYGHVVFDTLRGMGNYLNLARTDPENSGGDFGWGAGSFNSNGFKVMEGSNDTINGNGTLFASWSFRRAPRFFDIVTYTGDGLNGRTIPHKLGLKPGFIIIKARSSYLETVAWHRSTPTIYYDMTGNGTGTDGDGTGIAYEKFAENLFTSKVFAVGGDNSRTNAGGVTYVAYLFADDPSGIIRCDSYTGTGADLNITLGWEPQYLMVKSSGSSVWIFSPTGTSKSFAGTENFISLYYNGSQEFSGDYFDATPTGFTVKTGDGNTNGSGSTYTYCAIKK